MATETLHEARQLLQAACNALTERGWRKFRIDTYENPNDPHDLIRHHYSGGEFRLIRTHPDDPTLTARWDHRQRQGLPTVDQILQQLQLNTTTPVVLRGITEA